MELTFELRQDMDAIMTLIDGRAGGYISIAEARELTELPAERFDAAMIALAKLDRVNLHHHDHPEGCTPEYRAQLLAWGSTHYILAAKVRR